MKESTLTDKQFDIFKELVKESESIDVVSDCSLRLWVSDDDVVIFESDGSVFRRKGKDGVFNYRDLIRVRRGL
jgi:hypothetical protein